MILAPNDAANATDALACCTLCGTPRVPCRAETLADGSVRRVCLACEVGAVWRRGLAMQVQTASAARETEEEKRQ